MALVQHLLDGIEQRCALGAKPVLQCPVGAKKMSRGLVILLYKLLSRTGAGGSEKGSRRAVPVR